MLHSKKRKAEELLRSFGKLKDDRFAFTFIKRYFDKKNHTSAFQVISDRTCADLDFEEVFMFLDRTTSRVGQQFFYDRFRVIEGNGDQNKLREKLISRFANDKKFRLKIQRQLTTLEKPEVYYLQTLFQEEYTEPPRWFSLLPFLGIAMLISLVLAIFSGVMILVVVILAMLNIGIHYWNKKHLYQYSDSIPQLLKLKAAAQVIFKDNDLKALKPSLKDDIEEISKLRRKMWIFRTEAQMEGELQAAVGWVFELLKGIFVIEPILLFNVLRSLDNRRKEMESIFEFVGEVDCLISVASLRKGLEEYCIPEIVNNSREASVEGLYHPLILNCVKNDIHLKGRSVLLTGSNMSGKTSFIRSVGINALTALSINTCFANSFRLPRIRIYSAIRMSDDLLNDRSYYFEEVLSIREMMEKSHESHPNLFLLDEIFKGTNTVERIAAGKAVLSALNLNENLVFVSTHDVELADLLKEEYDLYHFSERVNSGEVDFDYKLKEGKVTERNAIRILALNDYPPEVIQEAFDIASTLDKEGEKTVKG